MSRREFHFVSGGSSKFWAIDDQGTSFEVTYGKIGTTGTAQTKTFADAAAMKKEYDKLVREKTSKGYVEVGATNDADSKKSTKEEAHDKATGDDSNQDALLSELYFSTTKNISDMDNMTSFIGMKVVNFKGPKSAKKGSQVFAIRVSYDDEDEEDDADFHSRLISFLDSEVVATTKGLIIGNWSLDGPESCESIVQKLIEYKRCLPNLVAMFHGDIAQEENEISWIEQTDLAPLLAAFPKLQLFRVRGGTGLKFVKAKHANLRALAVESGGLSRTTIGEICQAKFPNLEYLELWLGDEGYGGDCQVSDLQPILSGKAFPKLKYLGLRNSEITDDIAGVIISSPLIKQLETLDLSLGTLSDEGGRALLKLPQDGNLKRLDLHRHFLSNAVIKELKMLPFTLNLLGQEKPDDWGDGDRRFVAIGE